MGMRFFREWVMDDITTPEDIRLARTIVGFLEWAEEQEGNKDTYVSEHGYTFRRSVSLYGEHHYETVEDKDLAGLIMRFLREDK